MFTNQDFLNYFSELEIAEQNARDLYAQMAADMTYPPFKTLFTKLSREEQHHATLVHHLKKCVLQRIVRKKD